MIELAFALAVTGVAALHDLRTRTFPNWLTFGAAGLGALVHVGAAAISGARGIDLLAAFGESALGAIACSVVPFLLVRKDAMGRGDLKLFIALGAALGPIAGFEVQLYALVAAFAAAPIYAWRTGRLRTMLFRAWSVFKGRARDDIDAPLASESWMPFGPAIFAGVFLALITT